MNFFETAWSWPALILGLVCLAVSIALAVGYSIGRRSARRGEPPADRIRVWREGNIFFVSGVFQNDPHAVRELIRLYCIRHGLPPAVLGAGGVPIRGERGEAVWPFRFQGSEVLG